MNIWNYLIFIVPLQNMYHISHIPNDSGFHIPYSRFHIPVHFFFFFFFLKRPGVFFQKKDLPTTDEKELKAANILDILATKYILTQNFQDMKRLGDKEYCYKLVILTADVIKKFLKEREITYIAQRVVDGVPVNAKKTSSVIYLSTNKLNQQTRMGETKEAEYKKKVYPHLCYS